jgi:hypothetical protein
MFRCEREKAVQGSGCDDQPTVRDCWGAAIQVGFWVVILTPAIGHILKAANCDLVTFDMEHSGLGFETIRAALRSAEAAGLATIVRPPSKQYQDIARALDIGAKSLMFQMVDTAEEAREIVACMKYRPRGIRGVATSMIVLRTDQGQLMAEMGDDDRPCGTAALPMPTCRCRRRRCLYPGHVDLSVDLEFRQLRRSAFARGILAACRNYKHFCMGLVDGRTRR